MFMKKMRDSAKWVMLVLAFAFVGWLVFEGINDMRGGNLGGEINPVVGEVAGRDIRYNEWNLYLSNQLQAARQTGRSLNEEDERVVTESAWQSLINATLLQAELDRLEIEVTDSEIQQAFLTQPPPELLTHAAFQTDGQFDIEKYRRFFSDPTTDEATLLGIEQYYRSLLPRAKLDALVKSGIYVSDEEAWQFYRDTNETARVRFVRIDPDAAVPDSAVQVTDAEIRARYDEREDEFVRPATARVNMVSVTLRPSPADTVAAGERAAAIHARVTGDEDFETVATAESGDPASAPQGGFMGLRPRTAYDAALADATDGLAIGAITEPIETSFGFHIVRLDERTQDSLGLSQIFVPVEISPATEDSVFDLMDELEGIALLDDLTAGADSLGVDISTDLQLIDGVTFVPGAGALGVATDWALGEEVEIGELSQFFENATGFHVFELLGRRDESPIPLEEAAPGIREELVREKKKDQARDAALALVDAIGGGASLEEAAERFGWMAQESPVFRRGDFVPGLGQATEAIGEAFGAAVGGASRVADAGDAVAVLEVLEREEATRAGFEEVKEALLIQLRAERTQEYIDKWLTALREGAVVEDHRARLDQNADQVPATSF
ncbi:MAG: SurA N-terminal domain-containing protein [Gemmatimonadetes bacterium]|nr:SurA N-terminal domain-containing protein [Gemmatimonadota bacterium]